MKIILITVLLTFTFTCYVGGQHITEKSELKFKNINSLKSESKVISIFNLGEKEQSEASYTTFALGSSLWPLNPMLVIEDGKAYFGLTKEVSIISAVISSKKTGFMLRLGGEYSYIFRSERNSHIRAFLTADIPIEAGDFAAIAVSPGFGYFTDTKKSGLSPELSLGILAPFSDNFGIHLYLKGRNTFMLKSEEANIFDLSAGLGFYMLFFRF